jgi:two-component system response regulator FixJ
MRDMEPTVFIVDNDAPALKELEALMQSVKLHAEIYLSVEDFLGNYSPARPGCLILGVRMPRIGGIEAYRQLRREGSEIPVIFLTQHADIVTAVAAMREGAFDFMEKPAHGQYLIDRVQTAVLQDQENRRRNAERNAIVARLKTLSSRELEVVDQLMDGRTSKAIARELGISLKTVDFHRANVMRKIGVETIAHLVYSLVRGGYARETRIRPIPSGLPRRSEPCVCDSSPGANPRPDLEKPRR